MSRVKTVTWCLFSIMKDCVLVDHLPEEPVAKIKGKSELTFTHVMMTNDQRTRAQNPRKAPKICKK